MRSVFGLVLVLGIALAGGAAYMAKNYIDTYQTQLAKERAIREKMVKTVEVFVSERPLRYGEVLQREDVRVVDWPEDAIPEGAFTKEEDLFPENENEPRQVLRAMEKDEAILTMKVTRPGEDAGLTSRLQRGMRAFAIKVDVATGVSGFLRPGDRVDVYWSGRIAGNDDNAYNEVTMLIEAGVQIIAVDQSANVDVDAASIARTITVAVNPQEVAALAQAQSTGRLSLSLVGAEDDTVAEGVQIDQRQLLGLAIDAPVQQAEIAEPEKVCTIRTRRGAEVVEIPIPCTN